MITLGKHSYMGTYSERFEPVVEIGKFCSIASGLIMYGLAQHPQTISTYPFADKGWCDKSVYPNAYSRGKIVIGNDVWIGEDVTIMDGVTIGDGAIIGTRSVVSKNIPAYVVAVGCPIQFKKYRFIPEQIEKLLQIQWWNWSDEEIKKILPLLADTERFFKEV